ncbi:MAG: phenylalanine--tRNA ligase subunit alpha [Candidatus Levyibacteriota bacterium]
MVEKLLNIKNTALSLIVDANSLQELDDLKVQFLGRNGSLNALMKEMAKLPADQKPEVGRVANDVKTIIEDTLKSGKQTLKEKKSHNFPFLDATEPGIKPEIGHLHLITQAIREITTIFESIGFTRVRYPEISWDWYNFTALNFPPEHPARDDLETFYLKGDAHREKGRSMLNVHTSTGQVQHMERVKPPFKMLNIAKVYRRQIDVSHTPVFHQFETLVVGEKISIAHLKGVLEYFVKSYFGEDRKSRIRPYNFRFTEPSFETDVSCAVCNGTGIVKGEKCRLCKEGWLELGGAGMVHPNVLRAGGIDPEKYTGFASGWGVERVLMMKDGIKIDDLRILYGNDLDFLKQF